MIEIDIIDADHGDCLLLRLDTINILIDCGPNSFQTRKKVLKSLTQLLGEEPKIDFAIVTHNDDDHIGGFKFLLDKEIEIKTIIFNSLQDIPDIVNDSRKQISYNQDNALRKKLLEEKDITVQSLSRGDYIELENGIKLTAITPTINALEKMLVNSINKEKKNNKQIANDITQEITFEEALRKVKSNEDNFVKDPSPTNKSSIGLVIEYKDFKGLFLGDAQAEDVIDGLMEGGFNSQKFDVVKLSHHGSERNTSVELIKLIGRTEYILCANNQKSHKHPNNLTLARIFSENPNPTIHFSSDNVELLSKIQSCKGEGLNIIATYPTNGVNTIYYGQQQSDKS